MYFFNIKMCMIAFTPVGCNPKMKNSQWQSVLFMFNMVILVITIVFPILTFFIMENVTFIDASGAIESIVTMVHVLAKFTFVYRKRSNILNLVDSTLKFWNVENLKHEEDRRELSSTLKVLKLICFLFLFASFLTALLFMSRPFFMRVLPFDGYVPENILYYKIVVALEWYATVIILMGLMGCDILFSTLIVMVYAEMKLFNRELKRILNEDIRFVADRVAGKYKMRKCIRFHNVLMDFITNVNTIYSTVLLQIIMVWTFANSVEMYNVTKTEHLTDAVKYLMYIFNGSNEFIMFYCIPCQLLSNEIRNTKASIIDSDWNKNLLLYKREILMILAISDKPKIIVAGNFMEVSLATALAAFKTTISYFMFVSSVTPP